MFYSAKFILCQSFHAQMMENTKFENKMNGVSSVKVWSFLTKASSNQFGTFQVNCIVEKQNVTKAVDLIPATSVFSTDIYRFLLFHWKPPEYLSCCGHEFYPYLLETDILLQRMPWSRFPYSGLLDDMRFMTMAMLYKGDTCAFICTQLKTLQQQYVIPCMFLDMNGNYLVITKGELISYLSNRVHNLVCPLYSWKNIKDRVGVNKGSQNKSVLNLCYQNKHYLWSYTQMYKKPFVFTYFSATRAIFVLILPAMGNLTKYAEGRFVYQGYGFLGKNIIYTQNIHFGKLFFPPTLCTTTEKRIITNSFPIRPVCVYIHPIEGKITRATVRTIAVVKNRVGTLNRHVGNVYFSQIVANKQEGTLVKAPVLSTAMCLETFPVTNVPVYLNAFPARPVLCTLESYTGNTSVMTLGLTDQECYHPKKDFSHQNDANVLMPKKTDTDNLPVQTYKFAIWTIQDNAFQDCVPINRNGFEMLSVAIHLIERVFFQYILKCMQYASYHFLSEVISRHEDSACWFLTQPQTQSGEKGF